MYQIFISLKEISHGQPCFLLFIEREENREKKNKEQERMVMTDFLQGIENFVQCTV
jgi:hypothetical protein